MLRYLHVQRRQFKAIAHGVMSGANFTRQLSFPVLTFHTVSGAIIDAPEIAPI